MASRQKRTRRPKSRNPAKTYVEQVLTIDRLGTDGLGHAEDISVPFALPDEEIRARIAGKLGEPIEILTSSRSRATPPCPQFGLPGEGCGGCLTQHKSLADNLEWKTALVGDILRDALGDLPDIQTHQVAHGSRRRARLGLIKTGQGWRVGFRRWRSHHIVSLRGCVILEDRLLELARQIEENAALFLPAGTKTAEFMMTRTDTGIDLEFTGVDEGALSIENRIALSDFAAANQVARISVDGRETVMRQKPVIELGEAQVAAPSGVFLQAAGEGQQFLTQKVIEYVGDADRVADLFCGLGTFILPLAEASKRRNLYAADSNGDAVNALDQTVRRIGINCSIDRRDLFDDPLSVKELEEFDAVVFDPPRAGAIAQARKLADSSVSRVIAVSCNPKTLARDLHALSDTYRVESVSILDQFLYSPHVETVVSLRHL